MFSHRLTFYWLYYDFESPQMGGSTQYRQSSDTVLTLTEFSKTSDSLDDGFWPLSSVFSHLVRRFIKAWTFSVGFLLLSYVRLLTSSVLLKSLLRLRDSPQIDFMLYSVSILGTSEFLLNLSPLWESSDGYFFQLSQSSSTEWAATEFITTSKLLGWILYFQLRLSSSWVYYHFEMSGGNFCSVSSMFGH